MNPLFVGVMVVGGILYAIFKSDDQPTGDVKTSEPKEEILPERDVSRLRRELKTALKKEKKNPSEHQPNKPVDKKKP